MEKVHQNYVCTFMDNGFHENLNDKKNKIKKKKKKHKKHEAGCGVMSKHSFSMEKINILFLSFFFHMTKPCDAYYGYPWNLILG